jgi:hypothetical protein
VGTSRSGGELASKLNRLPAEMTAARKTALQAAGDKARPIMERAPGAPHLVAHRPVRVVVRMVGDDSLSLKWTPPGLVRLVNDPTKAHDVYPRGFVGTRGRGARAVKGARVLAAFGLNARRSGGALRIPGIGFRAHAHTRGTRGKHFVERGKQLARPVISKTYAQKQLTEPLRQVFGG